MNAVETIQAAIDQLEALRPSTTMALIQAPDDAATLVYPDNHLWKGNLARDEDAEMIVILWRTIDAQLGILRSGLVHDGYADQVIPFYADALARAILGGEA